MSGYMERFKQLYQAISGTVSLGTLPGQLAGLYVLILMAYRSPSPSSREVEPSRPPFHLSIIRLVCVGLFKELHKATCCLLKGYIRLSKENEGMQW